MQLKITTYGTADGAVVVHLAGEISLDEGPNLQDTLAQALEPVLRCLIVDMAEVFFCDSAGLNALLNTRTATTTAGVDLVLTGVGERITRLFWATGTAEVFTVIATVQEALDRPGDGSTP
ncbi:STAS domain-containing protein [Kitasatospora albolonga]|uniref:STAS domain-containing protein n=1 Tax=Kitasatospora albolonga TaxID=68173 RepID=UPI0035EB4AA3